MKHTVPVSYAIRLLEQARHAGCNTEQILRDLVIDQNYFTERSEIPALRYGEIYQQVMLNTGNEWFGIFADGKVPLGAFRLMCLTLITCSDLRQAIVRAGEFAEICRGLNVRYVLSLEKGDMARLTLSPSRSMPQADFDQKILHAEPESLMASVLGVQRLAEWLIAGEIPINRLTLTFSQSDTQKFRFETPRVENSEFDAKTNSFSFAAKFLDYPIVQNQDGLMAFLRSAPYHLVTEDPKHISTADKVRNILKRDVSGSMPSAEEVARQLNVSVTTLRRQLQKGDTSYQTLKDECRLEAAFHYLACADLSNNDVATLLGFDEPSAFFRSFKKWTGHTPGEYRIQLQQSQSLRRLSC